LPVFLQPHKKESDSYLSGNVESGNEPLSKSRALEGSLHPWLTLIGLIMVTFPISEEKRSILTENFQVQLL
jgi:hypothetical protein